jgi:hypothetical protein
MENTISGGRDPTTNNTIYQTKHYYAFMLKELKAVKNQTELEVKNGSVKQQKLNEVYETYQRVIVGLIREGIDFQYLKDENNPANSVVKIKVDDVEYECLNTAIRNILKDDYKEVMGFAYDGPKIDYEDNIASQQLNAAVQESLQNGENDFHAIPDSFKYENRKQKRYLKHAVIDVIELVVVILVFKVLMNNTVFNNIATYIYLLFKVYIDATVNSVLAFLK